MANQGKRMVPEYLIKKIGEGGGGTEYTAGTGIDITGSTISVDTETVAMKNDLATVATTGAYSDLSGTPTIPVVSANTGATPTATLTDLNVDGTVYGVSGGGSVDIDEETIIEDDVTGKIKTAVGGWKETEVVQLGDYTLLGSSGSDWDLQDSTLSGFLFNNLLINTRYDVTLTFTDTTVPLSIKEAYIQTSSKTSTKFGGDSALKIIDANDNTHLWEFYVDISQNNIHVWPSDSWVSPSMGSTLNIEFGTVENVTYHKIDSKYIPDVTAMVKTDVTLKLDSNNKLGVSWENGQNVQFSQGDYGLQASVRTTRDIENVTDSMFGWGVIKTVYGGGYNSSINIPLSDLTYDSTNNVYELTNQTLLNKLVNAIAKIKKDDKEWTCAVQIRGRDSDNIALYNIVMYLDSEVSDEGGTLYLYKGSLTSPSAMAYKFSVSDQTDYTPTGAYEKLVFQYNADLHHVEITFNNPETIKYMSFIDPIEPQFLPGFNAVPSVAGTYTLQATVDAQGNVTYSWVAVQP